MATKTYHGRPLAIDLSTGWSASTGTLISATDPMATIAHDDASSYGIYGNAGGAAGTGQPLRFTAVNLPNDILSITSVRVVARVWGQDARATVRALVGVGGSYTNASTYTTTVGSWVTTTSAALSNPVSGSGGVWTAAALHDPTFVYGFEITAWVDAPSPGQLVWLTTLYPLITYEPIPLQNQGAHDAASRRQWFFLTRPPTIDRKLRVQDALAADLMDLVGISHRDGPHASGLGWRSKNWQRSVHRIVRRETDPNTDMVTDGMRAVRPQLCLMRYTARAKSPSVIGDGVGFFAPGAELSCTRSGVAWVGDPSGGSLIVRVEADQLRYGQAIQPASGDTEDGLLVEQSGGNALPYSSFRNGLTGWTTVNGSGTITAATSPLRFAQTESAYVLKIVAGSPHSTASTATSTVTGTIAANSIFGIYFDYWTEAGATSGPGLVIQRQVDNNYYTIATQSWGASRVVNPVPASDGGWRTYVVTGIDIGSSNSTLSIQYAVEAGEPSGSTYYVGHGQIESPYPTTPIINEATGVTRPQDIPKIQNDSGERTFNEARGAVAVVAIPHFEPAEASGTHVIWQVYHDSNNQVLLLYSASSARWEVRWIASGTTYTAYIASPAPVRGVAISFGVRWTSDQEELGITARSLDIFANGVKGTGTTGIGTLSEVADSDWFLGTLGGAIRELQSYAYVPTDEEMAQLPVE